MAILTLTTVFFFFLTLVPYHLYHSVQLIYFLHPLHQIDPGFLSRDWFVTQTTYPHPFFGMVIAFLAAHEVLPQGLFFIHLIHTFLLVWGIQRFVRLFSSDPRVPVLVAFFLLFYFSMGLGQSDLFSSIVRPIDLALLFYLFSLTALLEEKIVQSFFFLGLSALFHIQPGIQGLLVLLCYQWLCGRRPDEKWAMGIAIFLLLFSPNLIPLSQSFSLGEFRASSDIFKVFFNFRSPHHYRASVFELSHSLRVLFPLFFLLQKEPLVSDKRRTQILKYVFLLLGFSLLALLSTEWLYWPSMGRLFFFGLTPFILLVGGVFLSLRLIQAADTGQPAGTLKAFLTFAVFLLEKDARLFIPLAIILAGIWLVCRPPLLLGGSLSVLSLFLLAGRGLDLALNLILAAILVFLLKQNWSRNRPPALAFLFLGLPALGLHLVFPQRLAFQLPRIAPIAPLIQDNPELAQTLDWIQKHTEKNTLLLSPPYQDGIRFFAKRSIVVDFHAHGFSAGDLREWKERLEAVTRTSGLEHWNPRSDSGRPQREWLRRGYLNLKAADVLTLARRYQFDYFLTEVNYRERAALVQLGNPVVFENASYLLFRIRAPSP